MAHGADDPAFGERLVPLDVDLSDLYLGAFLHNKNQLDRVGGGDALVGGLDHGKLTPALAQQLPEDDLRLLDPGRIELAFHREPDLAVLEALQDFRLRDRLGALVLDAPDDGPLFHVEHDDLRVGAVAAILHLKPDFLEKLRVPQRLEIPPESLFVVGVIRAGEDARPECVGADAPVTHEVHALHNGLLLGRVRVQDGPAGGQRPGQPPAKAENRSDQEHP